MAVALSRFLGPLPLDVVTREYHESELTITRNPVEFGADIADHAYVEPKRLFLDAAMASGSAGAAAVAAAYEGLLALQETREPFDIVTGLTLYRNMLIETITVDREPRYARVLYFHAELREVIIVDTETTPNTGDRADGKGGTGSKSTGQSNLSKSKLEAGATRDRGSPTVQRGNSATKEVPASEGSTSLYRALGLN